MEYTAGLIAFPSCFLMLLVMLYVLNRKPPEPIKPVRYHLCEQHIKFLTLGELAAVDNKRCIRCRTKLVDIERTRRVRSKKKI